MALRLGCMMLLLSVIRKSVGSIPTLVNVFLLVGRLSFSLLLRSQGWLHTWERWGKGNSWLGRGPPEAYLRVSTLLLILLEHGEASMEKRAWRSELNPG
ncbi:uncharacterized protein K441DRAFT_655746 [Cenococcum geophilum 1.58]|uniref:uncharacterized protein n=1 Tax=Cenococcum geophilum 1.58 TaxID=794803 RepID=UPI00358EC76B|nr:hypothetical protein K441DRAFT_655746 [Cenococcum geophilum 1.58]